MLAADTKPTGPTVTWASFILAAQNVNVANTLGGQSRRDGKIVGYAWLLRRSLSSAAKSPSLTPPFSTGFRHSDKLAGCSSDPFFRRNAVLIRCMNVES